VMTADVQPIRADEVGSVEPELLRLFVHHRDERLAVPVADVFRERHGGVVRALNQGRLDEVAHAYALARTEVHGRLADRGDIRADRKSTRLNFSHVAISYAVFCLKKKIDQELI